MDECSKDPSNIMIRTQWQWVICKTVFTGTKHEDLDSVSSYVFLLIFSVYKYIKVLQLQKDFAQSSIFWLYLFLKNQSSSFRVLQMRFLYYEISFLILFVEEFSGLCSKRFLYYEDFKFFRNIYTHEQIYVLVFLVEKAFQITARETLLLNIMTSFTYP